MLSDPNLVFRRIFCGDGHFVVIFGETAFYADLFIVYPGKVVADGGHETDPSHMPHLQGMVEINLFHPVIGIHFPQEFLLGFQADADTAVCRLTHNEIQERRHIPDHIFRHQT